MKDMDTKEAKRRAEWLNEHRAPKDWLIVTESEISSARTEFSAIERERNEYYARAASLVLHLPPETIAGEVQQWRDEFKADRENLISERNDLKVLLAQKTTQYEIAQKELAFIKSKCNEEQFVFLDDLSSEAGHPEEVLAFIKGDVKMSEKSEPDFATVLEFESMQNQIEKLTKLLRDTERTLDEARKLLAKALERGDLAMEDAKKAREDLLWSDHQDKRELLRERDEAREQNAKLRDIAERAIEMLEHNSHSKHGTIVQLRSELEQLKEGAK